MFEVILIYFNEDLTCNSKLEWHLSEIAAAFLGISENKEKENKLEKHLLNSLKDFLSNTRMFKVEKILIILSTSKHTQACQFNSISIPLTLCISMFQLNS